MTTELNKSNDQFFVTLGVMTDGSIPPGHGFLGISKLKGTNDPNERVELITGLSFYSETVLGVLRPFGPGHVITEKYKWLVNMPGLKQVTIPITEEQLAELLKKINTDRKNFDYSYPVGGNAKDGYKYKPGGPYFNMFSFTNCITYCFCAVESVGINVSHIKPWFGVPKLIGNLKPMYVSTDDPKVPSQLNLAERNQPDFEIKQDKDFPFYWTTPLNILIEGQPETIDTAKYKTWNQFAEILDTSQNLLKILEKRRQTLHKHGKQVKEINQMATDLQRLVTHMKSIGQYPNQIAPQKTYECLYQLENAIEPRMNALRDKHQELDVITMMSQMVSEMFRRLRAWIGVGPSHAKENDANVIDLFILNHVQREMVNKKHKIVAAASSAA